MNVLPKNYPRPYIYVYDHQVPIVGVIRFALTPTGRRSKYWQVHTHRNAHVEIKHENVAKSALKYAPKLRKGYTWGEWFIYC